MRIGIAQVDGKLPNLALMRLSAYHKRRGDSVEWYAPLARYGRVYASKIFTFTPDDPYLPPDAIRGGTGYDIRSRLPDEVEECAPDYSIYPSERNAYGFLTRGCINRCPWCVVPEKEGALSVYSDIETIYRESGNRRNIVLMDNNFISAPLDFCREQVEKMRRLNLRVDFNQSTDARLYNEETAAIMAAVPWLKYPRLSCDYDAEIPAVINAMKLLRRHGCSGEIMVYILAYNGEVDSALHRINSLVSADPRCVPFVMPFRNLHDDSDPPNQELKDLARWVNRVILRKSCSFEEYRKTMGRETP